MKNMTAKLFRNSTAVAVSVMVLSIALFLGMLYQYFSNQLMTELETETWLVAQGVELNGMDYLTGLNTENRVTWVDTDGTVLYDSQADETAMENHADREEIQQAMTGQSGTARRYSSTLAQQTLYAARRLNDGTVIRVASAQQTVVTLLLSMVQPILIILALSLLISAVLASRMAKRIIRPIVNLDLEHPEDCDTYEELTPLLSRIKHQNDTIQQQLLQLQQKQQEFAALTENMSEGFLLMDRHGHVLSYNKGALNQLGAQAPQGEVNALVLNRSESFRQAVDEVLSGHRSQQMLRLNGRCCQLLANPVMQGEEQMGAVMVLLDVTEQEQREDLRREFTANVSHELKTPLTSISGIAEIMQSGMVKAEDVQGFASVISPEAERVLALGAAFQLSLEVTKRLESAAQKNDVTIKTMGRSVQVHGVRRVLDEMIYNLCDNAIKYNRRGGTVAVTVGPVEGGVEVSVEDNGIGIPPEDQNRVFERFYRVDKSHSKDISGTGLGLSIVKHGAALHDGQIRLESTPGKGTTVTLLLPQG